MKLNVVLRTCSNSLLTPTDLKRVCGDNRDLLIRKCFYSLVRAIKNSTHDVHLTVIDDHSDAPFLDFIKSFESDVKMTVVNMTERGPNKSALAQFKTAADFNSLVYVVEDDYLHEENAIDFMLGAYLYFTKRYNTDIVIHPHDCPRLYAKESEALTRLYHDGVRYWREVNQTSNTILTHSMALKSNFSAFENLAKNYPKVLEDDTINALYYTESNREAPIRAFSPIPSVAYHVGYSTPTSISTTHSSWQHLWSRVEDWELIQGWFYDPDFYRHVVNSLPDGSTAVEVGSWRGRSTCCFASAIRDTNKSMKFYAVDTWEGSAESTHEKIIGSMHGTLFDDFKSNLKMCGVDDYVYPMKMTSEEASKGFEDSSVDFVMIDGAHDYESVKLDLDSWLPKVKKGGLIAGDDYSPSWPGVVKAVDEKFGSKVNVRGTTWYVPV